jgi:8-oxo-dGTP pyrophosphatase MutT (NUDIX family)
LEFHQFTGKLREELLKPLPGRDAQLKMSSLNRIRELMEKVSLKTSIPSSVLILFYPSVSRNEPTFVLIQRPEYNGVHGGQISLPGGRYEKEDKKLEITALRESREEVGVDPESVELIGRISDLYIPPSNFLVTPFIGITMHRPEFVPDPEEVAEIIEIPLKKLLDPKSRKTVKMKLFTGLSINAPCYEINGYRIWGATAMILSEMKEIAGRTML